MTDVVDTATRSRMMSGIRGKDTKPEKLIRSGLHRLGFRYRLHGKDLPGKPDLVLPKSKAVIFVHGCFWHFHDCHLFKMPSSRSDFWRQKLARNRERDGEHSAKLTELGWRSLVIWECALKGKERLGDEAVIAKVVDWINSDAGNDEIRGKPA